MKFYVQLECPECDETVYWGLCLTLIEHNGYPVVAYDTAAQEQFFCDNCSTTFYSGDFELLSADEVG